MGECRTDAALAVDAEPGLGVANDSTGEANAVGSVVAVADTWQCIAEEGGVETARSESIDPPKWCTGVDAPVCVLCVVAGVA